MAILSPRALLSSPISGRTISSPLFCQLSRLRLIAHDPDVYEDPMSFKPERYLGPNPAQDSMDFAFGFGRRICPGRFLADAAVWITMAKLLAAFTVLPPLGADGKEYLPEIKMTPGLVRWVSSLVA
jgi:cytochrome P450